nr:MAG TPA: hypothetical protein [Caudoviricetes sp.]
MKVHDDVQPLDYQKSQSCMISKKLVFLCWVSPTNANVIKLLKFDGKPQNSKSESKPSLVGWRRLSNTRLIIAKGY